MTKLYFYEVDLFGQGSTPDKFFILAPSFIAAAKFIENNKLYGKRKVCVMSRSARNIDWNESTDIFKVDSDGKIVSPTLPKDFEEVHEYFKEDNLP